MKQINKYLLETNFHITNECGNLNLLNAPFTQKRKCSNEYVLWIIENMQWP